MKKFVTVLLALLMMFSLVGCSSGETAGGEGETGGSLVIYSPNSDALVEVAYAFGEKYGIEVEVQSLGTGEALEKIVAEA